MGRVVSPVNMSIDGFIEDERGEFAWLPVDPDVFEHHTQLIRSADVLLYGRRLYEAMAVWETDLAVGAQSAAFGAFAAAWRAPEKVVSSRTLDEVLMERTRIEREFDPVEVARIARAANRDVLVGGAELAAVAFEAALIDEVHLYALPLTVGGGKPGLPTGVRLDLRLLETRRLGEGVVFTRSACARP
ncbi:dihydrofolate reductase family protein [Arenivirga flava]|uniref:Deaminase n=1 Tax=Arenivirga flava TaxID=1930060 RepID=A0AA37XA57_9MICO|nr:dihydrofolate reductase family protein [Arenivirga flava]GMA27463.1 deaminase [Arenivirga flava]